ncbi:HD domain-containing protein [Arthrobacter sp. SLBN-53]|uniref:HD domain-containing protein n=1 Tax=Arthrobacter sp. SLBN-53 TaxID=2768412 RepID=UPI0011545BFF|nr:HD domain-containing protein [Arthrobacter sp. SLBN-53]TQK29927.1 HD domain-containing protein [Arthrobacter sp. SLBN-53]
MVTQDSAETAASRQATVWNFPDSAICTAAFALADDVSPEFLHNHCVRGYLFGRELAAAQGLRGGVDYDEETVFLATILHDLGVTAYGRGDQRFEVDGADAAAHFLRERGFDEDRTAVVWQSIALHTSVGLGHRFGTEQAVCHGGIDMDVLGAQRELLPAGFADRVHAAWPRHNLGFAIAEAIGRDTQANPGKAPPFSFPAHVHEVVNKAASVGFAELVAGSGWGDSYSIESTA